MDKLLWGVRKTAAEHPSLTGRSSRLLPCIFYCAPRLDFCQNQQGHPFSWPMSRRNPSQTRGKGAVRRPLLWLSLGRFQLKKRRTLTTQTQRHIRSCTTIGSSVTCSKHTLRALVDGRKPNPNQWDPIYFYPNEAIKRTRPAN